MPSSDVPAKIRQYFRHRSRELKAQCKKMVAEHAGMRGAAREHPVRKVVRESIPQRYAVDHGMVYGRKGRSLQADAIVWDAENFPAIPQSDGQIVFHEATRLVIEVKSRWSSLEFADIRAKCRALRDLGSAPRRLLEDRVDYAEDNIRSLAAAIASLDNGEPTCRRSGLLNYEHVFDQPPPLAAVVLRGGETFASATITPATFAHGDQGWPEILLLLEPGRVVWDEEPASSDTRGRMRFFDAGQDALLVFVALVQDSLALHSSHIEGPFFLARYCRSILRAIPQVVVSYGPEAPKAPWTVAARPATGDDVLGGDDESPAE